MSEPAEHRLCVTVAELVELVRKAYATKMPDECAVCIGGFKLGADETVELYWTVGEAPGATG